MKKGTAWPVGIATILASFVAANLYLMRVAGADPSFAVEPDYYRKAVTFDSTIAEERRSAALGWSASTVITRTEREKYSTVTVTLADAGRRPITGASVTIEARFNARANEVLSDTLREVAPGEYGAALDVRHAGAWEVRVDAVRGAEHFVTSTRTDAPLVR